MEVERGREGKHKQENKSDIDSSAALQELEFITLNSTVAVTTLDCS
jgi:hypothetical protein